MGIGHVATHYLWQFDQFPYTSSKRDFTQHVQCISTGTFRLDWRVVWASGLSRQRICFGEFNEARKLRDTRGSAAFRCTRVPRSEENAHPSRATI